jgi:hypothetical protein
MSKEKKSTRGRPRIEIDLELVKKLCSIQCTAEEIASLLDVSEDTLDLRLKDAGYANFTEFHIKNRMVGKISLRRSQWKSSTNGNVTMQIWLGKQYLGQKEQPEQDPTDNSIDITISVKENENAAQMELEERRKSTCKEIEALDTSKRRTRKNKKTKVS